MTDEEFSVFSELAGAYRILREAYHHDMHSKTVPKTALQERVAEIIAQHQSATLHP